MSPLALSRSNLLFFIFFASNIAAASLDLCPLDGNATIANSSLTWGQVLDKPIQNFLPTSYLRPDIGKNSIGKITKGSRQLMKKSRRSTHPLCLHSHNTHCPHTCGHYKSCPVGNGANVVSRHHVLHHHLDGAVIHLDQICRGQGSHLDTSDAGH